MFNASRTPVARATWWLAIPISASLGAGALAQQPSASGSSLQVHQAEVAGAAGISAQMKAGENTFQTVCLACHQADGKGLPGAFPPLAGSDFLLGDKDRAVGVVVRGLEGEVVVNGVKYNSVMPAMTQLSDQEIADALTYAMNSWGNKGGAVPVAQVAAVRAKVAAEPKTAASPTQHPTTTAELKYQGAPSPAGAAGVKILVTPGRAGHDRARVQARAGDLLPALRRLPRRAAQGRHRQAAHPRHHPEEGHRVPQGVHQPGFAGRHAELGQVRRTDAGGSRHHGALRPARAAAAAGVGHAGDQGKLERDRAGVRTADQAAEQVQPRQHLRGHAA